MPVQTHNKSTSQTTTNQTRPVPRIHTPLCLSVGVGGYVVFCFSRFFPVFCTGVSSMWTRRHSLLTKARMRFDSQTTKIICIMPVAVVV